MLPFCETALTVVRTDLRGILCVCVCLHEVCTISL